MPYSVISPSGTRAYIWESSSNTIRTFDLESPNGSGGFTEIGSGTTLADSHGTYAPTLMISQDGGTLFLGGDAKILIIPLE